MMAHFHLSSCPQATRFELLVGPGRESTTDKARRRCAPASHQPTVAAEHEEPSEVSLDMPNQMVLQRSTLAGERSPTASGNLRVVSFGWVGRREKLVSVLTESF